MTDITARDHSMTVDLYLEAWNEEDAVRRGQLVAQAWSPDGHYVDPLLEAAGHEAVAGMAAAVHSQVPGHRFVRTSAVDAHHDRVRFGWQLTAPDGAVAVAGIDVGELAGDGRLLSITGFFGDLTPAAE